MLSGVRLWAVVLAIVLFQGLAGCQDAPSADPDDRAGPDAAVLRTDTFHLVKAPTMSRLAVNGSTPTESPLQDGLVSWSIVLIDPLGPVANASWSVWVRVPPNSVSPTVPLLSCRWAMTLYVRNPGVEQGVGQACSAGPGLVDAGDLRLHVALPPGLAAELDLQAGSEVRLELETGIVAVGGEPVVALGGTVDRDSHIRFEGLQDRVSQDQVP
jgi:hypothetical protein